MILIVQACSYLSRFFTKGAVDVYNSPTVLVSGSEFAHNSISFVSKADPYRGHSAGLSIGEYDFSGAVVCHSTALECRIFNPSDGSKVKLLSQLAHGLVGQCALQYIMH